MKMDIPRKISNSPGATHNELWNYTTSTLITGSQGWLAEYDPVSPFTGVLSSSKSCSWEL